MSVQDEIESFTRIRPLKGESFELYLCRAARAVIGRMQGAAEALSPKAFAWAQDAAGRLEQGWYPLEFEDPSIEVSVADQLFELLEKEDAVEKSKLPRPKKVARASEGRRAEFNRVAHYLLMWPGAGDEAVARELSSTGWSIDRKTVRDIRHKMNMTFYALKDCGFIVRRADGGRIIGV